LNPASASVYFKWLEDRDESGPDLDVIEHDQTPQFGEKPLLASSEYNLPKECFFNGPTIVPRIPRNRDSSLPMWSAPDCPLRLKVTSARSKCNEYSKVDVFFAEMIIVNTSKDDISVLEARAYGKLRLNPEDPLIYPPKPNEPFNNSAIPQLRLGHDWTEIPKITIQGEAPPPQPVPPPVHTPVHNPFMKPNPAVGGFNTFGPPPVFHRPAVVQRQSLPMKVPAGGSIKVEMEVMLSTVPYDGELYNGGSANSWIISKAEAPLVFDIELEDMNGSIFGGMIEYVLNVIFLLQLVLMLILLNQPFLLHI
jgi:hypothetical protein